MKTAEKYLQREFGDEWYADLCVLPSTSLLQLINNYGNYREENATGYSIPCSSTLSVDEEKNNSIMTFKAFLKSKLGDLSWIDLFSTMRKEDAIKLIREYDEKIYPNLLKKVKEKTGKDISPMDYVLTDELELAIRLCGKRIDYDTVDKIIDLVELIVENKGKVTIKDLVSLQKEWKK